MIIPCIVGFSFSSFFLVFVFDASIIDSPSLAFTFRQLLFLRLSLFIASCDTGELIERSISKGCMSLIRSETDLQLGYAFKIRRFWVQFQVWAANIFSLLSFERSYRNKTLCQRREYSWSHYTARKAPGPVRSTQCLTESEGAKEQTKEWNSAHTYNV